MHGFIGVVFVKEEKKTKMMIRGKKDLFEQLYLPFTEIYWTIFFIVLSCKPTIIVVDSPLSPSPSFPFGLDEKIVFQLSNRGNWSPPHWNHARKKERRRRIRTHFMHDCSWLAFKIVAIVYDIWKLISVHESRTLPYAPPIRNYENDVVIYILVYPI